MMIEAQSPVQTIKIPEIEPRGPGTEYKAAEFIETYTGRAFYPLHPDPSAISIIDIARGLSLQCRYGGQISDFYSVAEHSVLLAVYAEEVLHATVAECLQVLIHDAPEAYMTDIPRPVKQYMPEYREWDHGINDCIREWLDLSDIKPPTWLDTIDGRIIVDERAQLKSDSGLEWGHNMPPLGIEMQKWQPRRAEIEFLMRYTAYTNSLFGKPQYAREGWNGQFPKVWHDSGSDDPKILDILEVDLRGGVARVKLRSDDGMLVRDKQAGKFPRPAWEWRHGKFTLTEART
jgi:hypothetical protein